MLQEEEKHTQNIIVKIRRKETQKNILKEKRKIDDAVVVKICSCIS